MANFSIKHEVTNGVEGEWRLCFQFGTYTYEKEFGMPPQEGYRFIWRKPDGSLHPARGQARIPSKQDMFELLALASAAGWF